MFFTKINLVVWLAVASLLGAVSFSTSLLAQDVTTSVDRFKNQVTTVEYKSGWKVVEKFKPSANEVTSCEIYSDFNAPMALEIAKDKKSLYVVVWDVAFGNYYKDSEWFNVAVESQSFNFEKRFMYRGTSDAVTWWDTPSFEADSFINIIRKNGRISFYYDGVGVRHLKLVGNEDAISLFDKCAEKMK